MTLMEAVLEACAGLIALAVVLVLVVPPLLALALVSYGLNTLKRMA